MVGFKTYQGVEKIMKAKHTNTKDESPGLYRETPSHKPNMWVKRMIQIFC